VFILDEQLQQIPVECMPLLRGRRCSRVPSLALFLHMAAQRAAPAPHATQPSQRQGQKQRAPSASSAPPPMHGWYAIDPEKNLSGTRSTMLAFLEPYIARWAWRGYVAEMPTEDMVKELHTRCDVFVYCGHGAGEKMCETHKMRRWPVLPAAYLWGCSSGRLATMGVHDPTGAALNYLLGGATFVVGNMWDVTDKDIDKLSKECMRLCFDGPGAVGGALPVTQALALSRDVCKMRFAVGCAPVVYGF
jgi:separase